MPLSRTPAAEARRPRSAAPLPGGCSLRRRRSAAPAPRPCQRRAAKRGGAPADPFDAGSPQDRRGARGRHSVRCGYRSRGPRDQAGHPRLHRVGWAPHRSTASACCGARAAAGLPRPAAASAPSDLWTRFYREVQHPEFPVRAADTVEPMDKIRRLTAEHMVLAKRVAPHVHSFIEVDFSAIDAFARRASRSGLQQGAKVSYTAFVAWAVSRVLREFPTVNATVSGNNVIFRGNVSLGMAVDSEPGAHRPGGARCRSPQPGRDRQQDRRSGWPSTDSKAGAERNSGRDVLDHEPGRARHARGSAGDPERDVLRFSDLARSRSVLSSSRTQRPVRTRWRSGSGVSSRSGTTTGSWTGRTRRASWHASRTCWRTSPRTHDRIAVLGRTTPSEPQCFRGRCRTMCG